MPLRLVFMGTPDFAVPTLAALVAHNHEVVAVYTRAPQPAGRGMELRPSPVEREARRLDIAVLTPKTLRTPDAQAAFRAHGADAAVVVAYGLILPKPALDAPRLGCFNLHASALPRWRGAAPINRAIMAGDTKTAATVMQMAEGLDTGPVALTAPVAIGTDMTAGELHDQLAQTGANLMVKALEALACGALSPIPQADAGVTYAAKIDNAETRIDWTQPCSAVHNHVRGLSPFPGAWCEWPGSGAPVRVKILRTTKGAGSGAQPGMALDGRLTIACGDGAVRILELQRAGRQPMRAEDFLRGTALPAGTRLS
jgi:methionyl-tRNA formyltransferase